jgi:hypothetical protein
MKRLRDYIKKPVLYIVLVACVAGSAQVLSERPQNQAGQDQHGQFLCTAEYSTGYELKNGRWLRERFMPNDKYKVTMQQDGQWTVYAFMDDYKYTECEPVSEGVLQCNIEADFTMNFETMKFSVTSTSSYVHSKRRNRSPVVLTLGTCVKL